MALTLLVIVGLWLAFAWGCQRAVLFPRQLTPPVAEDADAAVAAIAGAEVWKLETDAGVVEAFFLPGEGASADDPGPAVVFAHGNGEVIDLWPGQLARYREMGVSVLLPEYRGYGRSGGRPSQRAILADFEAFHDRLTQRDEVDPDRIVFHGRSLGGAVVAVLSERRQPAAIVLEATFTSVADMARRYLVPGFLVRDPLRARQAVERFDGPVLILHGENDTIVPPRHARRMSEAAPQARLVWLDMGHNDPPPQREYWRAIERFLEEAAIVEPAGAGEAPR